MAKLSRILFYVWMASMLGLGIWSLVPPPRLVVELPLNPLRLSDGREVLMPGRSLRLDLPVFLRVGESQDARFEITAGQQPADYSFVATARLELSLLAGEPQEVNAKLVDGQAARFSWKLLAREVGTQEGLLWLTVATQKSNGLAEDIALLARPVEVPVRSELLLRIGVGLGLALGLIGWVLSSRYRR